MDTSRPRRFHDGSQNSSELQLSPTAVHIRTSEPPSAEREEREIERENWGLPAHLESGARSQRELARAACCRIMVLRASLGRWQKKCPKSGEQKKFST